VGLNHVAFDGSKIKANASPKKAMTQEQLKRRIKKLLKKSILTDEEEDEIFVKIPHIRFPKNLPRILPTFPELITSCAQNGCILTEIRKG